MLIIKVNNKIAILFWVLGIVLTPYLLRNRVFPSGIYPINLISWLGITFFIYYNYKKIYRLKFSANKYGFIYRCIIWGILLLLYWGGNKQGTSTQEMIKWMIAVLLPLFIMDLRFKDYKDFSNIFSSIVKIVNITTYIVVICMIIDLISGLSISRFLSNLYNIESLYGMVRSERSISYLGHSLVTTEALLISYMLNFYCWSTISKKTNMILSAIMSVIGIALSGSKTGLILIIAMIFISYINRKMLRYIPILIVGLFILYRAGIFEMITQRILIGITRGDITTNRNVSLLTLFNQIEFQWFLGQKNPIMGNYLVAATEYPFIRWMYRFGIIFAVTIFFDLFIRPLMCISKYAKGSIREILIFCCIVIDVNTYSSLPGTTDGMLVYCSLVFLFINLIIFRSKGINQEVNYVRQS